MPVARRAGAGAHLATLPCSLGRRRSRGLCHSARRQRLVERGKQRSCAAHAGEEAEDARPAHHALQLLGERHGRNGRDAERREQHRIDGRAVRGPEGVGAGRGEHGKVTAHAREECAGEEEEERARGLHSIRVVEHARRHLRERQGDEGGLEANDIRHSSPAHTAEAIAKGRQPPCEGEEAVISKRLGVESKCLVDSGHVEARRGCEEDDKPEKPEGGVAHCLAKGAIVARGARRRLGAGSHDRHGCGLDEERCKHTEGEIAGGEGAEHLGECRVDLGREPAALEWEAVWVCDLSAQESEEEATKAKTEEDHAIDEALALGEPAPARLHGRGVAQADACAEEECVADKEGGERLGVRGQEDAQVHDHRAD
mmetsp:Transcript_22191/g.59856  ORF Transcript_22191/g.59856 Transcript_22191/m.59856 type:complete len:370 (+) Transcript_22191:455-1564(+)